VKTAGVDDSIRVFAGPARVFESQDEAVSGILTGKVQSGEIVVIRYEVLVVVRACRKCFIRRAT